MSLGTKTVLPRVDRHLLALSAAAVAGVGTLGVTQQAEAAIVYSGAVSINIPSTTSGVYLNVQTGVNNPSPGLVPGWDVNPWSSTTLNQFTPTPNPGGGAHVGSGTLYDNLPFGTVISGASSYGSTGTNTINPATPLNLNSSNNLVGFRFINEANAGAIHYGWMRIMLSGTPQAQPRAIVEYAYEDVAGAPIAAGDIGGAIPEPAALSLLAIGAVGLMRRRGRI